MKRLSTTAGAGLAIVRADAKDRLADAARAAGAALDQAGAFLALGLQLGALHAVKLVGNAFFVRGEGPT